MDKYMRTLVVMLSLLGTMTISAQQEVTRFLGIPVNGTKAEMVQQLKEKGFRHNPLRNCLEGEFNGGKVRVSIVTNKELVWRVMVEDAHTSKETDIKIRFNNLCQQFMESKKYILASPSDPTLSDKVDLEYEISINKKRIEAAFYQMPADGDTSASSLADASKRSVWMMIARRYDNRYRIILYYDNEYNHTDGEDL